MTFMFKIWDWKRQNKTFVLLHDSVDLYVNLVLKASEKLQIDGSSLVLESDGTLVDADDVLRHLDRETLILLTKNEKWTPYKACDSLSTCTTETMPSLASSEELISTPNILRNREELHTTSSSSSSTSDEGYCLVSESTWKNFQIPWTAFTKSVIEDCENGRTSYSTVTAVVHGVVDRVRDIKKHVPTKVMKIVASKIIDKYSMFQDVDEDNVVLGDGLQTLTQKLIERNNYLNRPHKRKQQQKTHEISPKQKKLMLSRKSGCANWQPDAIANDYEISELQKISLKEAVSTSSDNVTLTKELVALLNETYPQQRLFLNNSDIPTVEEINKEFPILLKKEGIYWHYEKLMGHSISSLITVFKTKIPKILAFGMDRKYISTKPEEENKIFIAALEIIAKFFNENMNSIIIFVKNQAEKDHAIETINSPLVISEYNANDKERHFSVFVERYRVETSKYFQEIFQTMFALYYNLNLCYPSQVALTLEFVQRYILKINPDQGTKGKKKGKKLIKLCSLMNKLKNFEEL